MASQTFVNMNTQWNLMSPFPLTNKVIDNILVHESHVQGTQKTFQNVKAVRMGLVLML